MSWSPLQTELLLTGSPSARRASQPHTSAHSLHERRYQPALSSPAEEQRGEQDFDQHYSAQARRTSTAGQTKHLRHSSIDTDRRISSARSVSPVSSRKRNGVAFPPAASHTNRRQSAASPLVGLFDMAAYDADEPPVPRTSKQAQLLGVDAPPSLSTDRWEGWAVTSPGSNGFLSSTPGASEVADVAPWSLADHGPAAASTSKASRNPTTPLRHPKSAVSLRPESRTSDSMSMESSKGHRKGLFSMLRRQARKSDTSQDRKVSHADVAKPPAFDHVPLPAKLQARGDAEASRFSRGNRKQSAAASRRNNSVFTTDPDITLDTNLDSMEGIVDFSAASSTPTWGRKDSISVDNVLETAHGKSTGQRHNMPLSPLEIDPYLTPRAAAQSPARPVTTQDAISSNIQRPIFARGNTSSSLKGLGFLTADDRRPSAVPPSATSVAPKDSGAWIAPDSWAVKGDTASEDSSDEGDDSLKDEDDTLSEEVMTPSEKAVPAFGTTLERPVTSAGRPITANGRPSTRAGRPSTADAHKAFGSKNYMVRISRPDGAVLPIPASLGSTASELSNMLARRFGVNATDYSIYMREKGLERRLAANEKPALLQKRKFEHAGYNELDKLEDLGREDHSYLCKFIFKPQYNALVAVEDEIGDTLEFVDLSGKSVETIPIFLYRHAHEIVSLNLSRNRPFDLPSDFIQLCTSLRELVISNMGIKRIPQSVKECYSLTRLDISNNNIVELDHIMLDELTELTSLKCYNNRLFSIPDYFRNFRKLKYLHLSNNRFESIAPVVCEIDSLIELDLSFNTVSSIPEGIGALRNLERLVLSSNMLTSLPVTFANLERLKELDVRGNNINDLSPAVTAPKLEVVRCEDNAATALDVRWSNIRILGASQNSISRFVVFNTGQTLTSLNLSQAKISTLPPDMFDHLGALESLTLDTNQIRSLPEGIDRLISLVELSMKNNLLDELPEAIGNLQRLQFINVSGNNLPTLPASIWQCSQLVSLNASSNMLKDFPDPPLQPDASTMSFEDLEARKLSVASKAPSAASSNRLVSSLTLSLQRLYLADNQLGDEIFAPVSLMSELRVLNLSFNEIFEIPSSSLFKLQLLEELYLSGNKLTTLPPDDLERLVNLKLLYLNGNKLQTLPAELAKIKQLKALDVGSNVLKYNIANWPYDWNWNWNLELRYLNLSGNKRLEIKPGHSNDPSNLPRSAKRHNLADFSALSRLHILGLMDVTLMIPSLPDENEDRRVRTSMSEINDMAYGIADTLGSRVDNLSLVDIVVPRFRTKEDEAVFGLFDAVSNGPTTGAKIVKYLQDSFTAVLTLELSRLKSDEVTEDALRRAFLGLNRDYGNLLLPAVETRRKGSDVGVNDRAIAEARTGASGIVVYVRQKKMFVANTGDSLAVVGGRGGTARLVSAKHSPSNHDEISRIRAAEGWVSHRAYVNDEVGLARSFGFYNVFPAVNAAPHIEEVEVSDADEFLIIANRGLWEHVSYQSAVDVARTERDDPMMAAAKLRDLAISYGSSQNIMVMVIAIGDVLKAKKDYRLHRAGQPAGLESEGFYGARKGAIARRVRNEGAGERYLNLLDREVAPPVGLVALVFTDIRNSTALWESNPGMQTAIRMHNQLIRRQLRAIGGYEVKTEGDAFMVSFPTVASALLWCLTVQLELLREDWPQEILDSEEGREIYGSRGELLYRGLSVRMGIHWGAPVCEADPITRRMDYFGPVVNRASRIAAVAEGGQISASQDVIEIIQDVIVQKKDDERSVEDGTEDEEEWLDENEKRDVMALRRLGFNITEIGERRLKGLETPELLSLLFPASLKERIKKSDTVEAVQVEVISQTSHILDATMVTALGRLVQRLEATTTMLIQPSDDVNASSVLTARNLAQYLAPQIRPDSTDEELITFLDSFTTRLENCIASLTLHQMGPIVEVLTALGEAIRIDPRYIVNAMSRYRALMNI